MRSWLLWLTLAPISIHVIGSGQFAPATSRLQVRHTPDATDRLLTVIADGENYYRSSEVTLDGLNARVLDDFELRDIPAGNYEIRASVGSWTGRARLSSRDRGRALMQNHERKDRQALQVALAQAEAENARLRLRIRQLATCTDKRCGSLCAACCQAAGLLDGER